MNKNDILARWPLFEITTKGISKTDVESGWYYLVVKGLIKLNDEKKVLSQEEVKDLDLHHANVQTEQQLRKKFPHLFISIFNTKVYCWLKVNDRDREGLSTFNKNDSSLDLKLSDLNKKCDFVYKNSQSYFICSSCLEECILDKDRHSRLNYLLDEKENKFLKFKDAGSGFFCEECVEKKSSVQKEYQLSIKLGSKYYD